MPVYTESRRERLQRLYRRTVHELASARRSDDRGRVAQLYALEERLDAEIRGEGGTSLRPAPTRHGSGRKVRSDKGKPKPPNAVDVLLSDLGLTGRQVRAWAGGVGRVSRALVEAYADAHPHD